MFLMGPFMKIFGALEESRTNQQKGQKESDPLWTHHKSLITQKYNGPNVMNGAPDGVQSYITKTYPYAHYVKPA